MIDLTVDLGKIKLSNPILTASGTFGTGEEFKSFLDLNRLGGIITKAVTLEPREGNPAPRIAETASGMLNSIGLANVGARRFVSEKLPFLKTLSCPVFVNVAGKTVEEFVEVIKIIEEAGGVDGYELNVSCPNVKQGGMAFGTNPEITGEITRLARKATDRFLFVKLTPNVTSIEEIAMACEENGADGLTVINTLVGMAVDIKTRRPKLATVTGGLSGPAIKPVALAKVYQVAKKTKIPVIASGGIMTVEDVIEFMITGAHAVQIGTANFINPKICEELVDDLKLYCEKNGIKTLKEIIGTIKVDEAK